MLYLIIFWSECDIIGLVCVTKELGLSGGTCLSNAKFMNIGNGSVVAVNRIISILHPESAPIKRMIQDARDKGYLIDATYGKKTRTIFVMDSEHVVLSAVKADTIESRMMEHTD